MVHLNRDVEQICPLRPANCRTEFRVFRCIADAADDRIELQPGFMNDTASVQLLSAAALSEEDSLRQLWNEYATAVTDFVNTLPPVFGRFLRANFYEATGEPRDVALLDLLPSVSSLR